MNRIDVSREHPVLQGELDVFYHDLHRLHQLSGDQRFVVARRLDNQAGKIRIKAGSSFRGLPHDFPQRLSDLFDDTACILERGNTDQAIARIASDMRDRAMRIVGIPPPIIVFVPTPKTPDVSSRLP